MEGKKAVEAARAEGVDTLPAERREPIVAAYDQWVDLGLLVFPERPPEAGQKGRVRQEPATNLAMIS